MAELEKLQEEPMGIRKSSLSISLQVIELNPVCVVSVILYRGPEVIIGVKVL